MHDLWPNPWRSFLVLSDSVDRAHVRVRLIFRGYCKYLYLFDILASGQTRRVVRVQRYTRFCHLIGPTLGEWLFSLFAYYCIKDTKTHKLQLRDSVSYHFIYQGGFNLRCLLSILPFQIDSRGRVLRKTFEFEVFLCRGMIVSSALRSN